MSDEIIERKIDYTPDLEGTDYPNFGVRIIAPSEEYRQNYDRIFRKEDDSLWKIPTPKDKQCECGEKCHKCTVVEDPYSDKDRLVNCFGAIKIRIAFPV
jgi:hypothetical protein